jgi:acyl carrier protein
VIETIQRQLHASDRNIDWLTRFVDDLGADSPGLVRWTHAFEETLDVEIPNEEADRIRTLEDASPPADDKGKAGESGRGFPLMGQGR